jgi:hypothetical protein
VLMKPMAKCLTRSEGSLLLVDGANGHVEAQLLHQARHGLGEGGTEVALDLILGVIVEGELGCCHGSLLGLVLATDMVVGLSQNALQGNKQPHVRSGDGCLGPTC